MGGHGGLNILPQKRWHVYRDDNRLRVLRDEREFQEAIVAERQQQQRRVMSDVVTLLKRRKLGATGESPAPSSPHLPATAPSDTAEAVRTPKPRREKVPLGIQEENVPGRQARNVHEVLRGGGSNPVGGCTPGDQGRSSPRKITLIADDDFSCKRQLQATTLPTNAAHGGTRDNAPVLARPFDLKRGKIDSLGRRQDGHFNFFAAAEREASKQQKERERYLLQAGHSATRQSEFSGILKEQKNVWYQSEMPSNRLAREEREGHQPNEKTYTRVEAAAEGARRQMLAAQQQQPARAKPGSSCVSANIRQQQTAESIELESGDSDSDVCISSECFILPKGSEGNGSTREAKAKKAASKSDRRSSRRERKLLKQMKRKWMLKALELHSQVQSFRQQIQTQDEHERASREGG